MSKRLRSGSNPATSRMLMLNGVRSPAEVVHAWPFFLLFPALRIPRVTGPMQDPLEMFIRAAIQATSSCNSSHWEGFSFTFLEGRGKWSWKHERAIPQKYAACCSNMVMHVAHLDTILNGFEYCPYSVHCIAWQCVVLPRTLQPTCSPLPLITSKERCATWHYVTQ